MSARRHFVVEIDDKIAKDAVLLMSKRPIVNLDESAGYIRGLQAAKTLYEEINKANNAPDKD